MLVSVIIPCFNVEQYISECIESVMEQTHSEIEIICINNNSTDKTQDILDELKNKFPDKIQILKEINPGAPAARNNGLLISKGEWVQFLDADDLLLPDKIAHQIEITQKKSDVKFIAGAHIKKNVTGEEQEIMLLEQDPFKALFITKLGITSANLFNADSVKNVGGWNETLKSSQESDLMFKLLKNGSIVEFDNISNTIIRERHIGQISQRDPKNKWLQYIFLRTEIINFLKKNKKDYFNKEKNFYYQNLFSQLRVLAKFDLKSAVNIFNDNFEKTFVPSYHSGFLNYAKIFKLFGFKKAEQIKALFDKINPQKS